MAAEFHIPERGERLLFLAPHPDDEALAAAGLIHEARRRGAEVTVAFLTSGDGFALGAAAHFRRWPSQSAMRKFAAIREAEAALVAGHLGSAPSDLRFLGYPDRGLASLWLTHWERPYPSRYTGRSATYTERPATGCALLHDLEELIEAEAPNLILYPDPADDHPDHWSGSCFTRTALERLSLRGHPLPETTWTYLTHRGLWPQPLEERPAEPLQPPPALTPLPIEWVQVSVTPEALQAKRKALAGYRSQTRLVANFFRGFIRGGELFSHWPEPILERNGAPVHLADPVRDRWGRSRCGPADVEALELEQREETVEVRVRLRKPAIPGLTYLLHWITVDDQKDPSGPRTETLKRELRAQVLVPGGSRLLLLGAEVWCGPILLDRTPWRAVRIPSPETNE